MDKTEIAATVRTLPNGHIHAECGGFVAVASTEARALEMLRHLLKTGGRGQTPAGAVGLRLTQRRTQP